ALAARQEAHRPEASFGRDAGTSGPAVAALPADHEVLRAARHRVAQDLVTNGVFADPPSGAGVGERFGHIAGSRAAIAAVGGRDDEDPEPSAELAQDGIAGLLNALAGRWIRRRLIGVARGRQQD